MYIFAQIIGLIALALSFISYQQKTHAKILLFVVLSCSAFCLHFFLLKAYTGALLNAVAAVRAAVFAADDKKWVRSKCCLALFCIISVAATAITWTGPLTILPMLGMICTTFSTWVETPKYTRLFAFPSSPLWIVYNAVNQSFAGIICEVFNMISIIIGFIRLDLKKSK